MTIKLISLIEDKSTDLWTMYHGIKPQIFDVDSAKDAVAKMKLKIKAPYLGVQYSTSGGGKNVIYIVISLDNMSTWTNGILENSRYFRMSIDNDGTMGIFSGSHLLRQYKFRKTKAKSVDDAIAKINKYVELASKGDK
jgi:hypothetical protein